MIQVEEDPAMTDTIIAQSTPPGQSALAIVRVSGPLCDRIAKEALALPSPTPRVSHLRNYQSSDSEIIVDQVISVFFPSKKSFTGESTLEISCHGNPFIVEKILEDLVKRGCRIAKPGEFTKRAFLSGKIDLTQAESIAELISAKSEAELKIANLNLAGAQGSFCNSLQDKILTLQAKLEASIDYPEEEIESDSKSIIMNEVESIINEMRFAIESSGKKKFLTNGIKVLILGPANVGKSTLFNSLIGAKRALVSQTPGTTRDYISSNVYIGDFQIELIDCAGIRTTENSTENLGIEKTIELIDEAFLVLFTVDASLPYPIDFDQRALDKISGKAVIVVENKKDLTKVVTSDQYPENIQTISISARDDDDVKNIVSLINAHLAQEFSHDPSKELMVNTRHANLLDNSLPHLLTAKTLIEEGEGEEFVLQELSNCREFIDEIIGIKSNEDILDKIFCEFCIGK